MTQRMAGLMVMSPTATSSADLVPELTDFVGMVLMGCIILLVVALIIAVITWAAGRAWGRTEAIAKGFQIAWMAALGAAIIGSVSGLVMWGSDLFALDPVNP